MADLSLRLLADAGGAAGAFRDFSGALTAAGAIVKEFAADSIKAFMEAEKVQKQLARAAGENAEAFSAMAEVMSQELAVEDEHIKTLQTLALSYDILPQNVEGATRAVLNWSAATGKDAKGAMLELIKSVEAGTGSLDRGRITFEATGDEATDLANAIAALNGKFGGAAAADADTLAGRARAADIAVGELKETVGNFFALIESKLGLLQRFNTGMQFLMDPQGWMARQTQAAMPGLSIPSMTPGMKAGAGSDTEVTAGDIVMVQGKTRGSKSGKDAWGWGPFGDPEKSFDGWLVEKEEYDQKKIDELNEAALKEAAEATKRYQKELEAFDKKEEAKLETMRKTFDAELDTMSKHESELDQRFKVQTDKWRQAGDSAGAAMVNAIGDQLLRLAEGGDVDPAAMAGDIASTVLSVVGMAIGSYVGSPQLGAAIGGLAGGLAKTGIVAGFGRKKKHDGGWIERFHGGGWPGMGSDEVPALLQTGERVLSRREVGAMGGPSGVERAARGGGSMVVNISALDAQSFQESFGGDGGRGFFNAIRVGRGDLVPLFGSG